MRAVTDGNPGLRTLVLDLEGVNFVDSQGAAKLTEIQQLTDVDGITLRLARVKPDVLAVLRAEGLLDKVGPDHVHGNVHRAVDAHATNVPTQAGPDMPAATGQELERVADGDQEEH